MLSQAERSLYWSCAGDILTRGDACSLAASQASLEIGCRPIGLDRAEQLERFYRRLARAQNDEGGRTHCLARADELACAMDEALAWRRAAAAP